MDLTSVDLNFSDRENKKKSGPPHRDRVKLNDILYGEGLEEATGSSKVSSFSLSMICLFTP